VTPGQAPGGCPPGESSLAHANLQHWLDFFCSSAVTEASLGVIQPLTAQEACGFLGCMVVETGEPELENLDVIEAGSGAGRGAMQYTGVRRTAYDTARLRAIAEGIDPNSNGWQEQYFAEEYARLHDPPQLSSRWIAAIWSSIRYEAVVDHRPANQNQAPPNIGHPSLQSTCVRVWGFKKPKAAKSSRFCIVGHYFLSRFNAII